jgi:Dicarboxylate transport
MRRIAIGLGAILIVLVALAAAALAFRFRITAAALRYGLSQAGFADAHFDVERFDPSRLIVARVESDTALRIERCEVDFDWRRLPRLPIDRVRLVGLRFDATRRRAAPEAEPGSAAPLPLGLVPVLELEDAVVTAASPIGPVSVRLDSQVAPGAGALRMHLEGSAEGEAASAAFSGDARLAQGGAVSMTMNLSAIEVRDRRARIAGGSLVAVIEGDSFGLALRNAAAALDLVAPQVSLGETKIGGVVARVSAKLIRKGGAWTAEITDADVRLPDERLHASGISGKVSAGSAKLLVSRLEDTATARRFQPISIDLRVPETRPDLKFIADVSTASGRATLRVQGSYDSARHVALAELTLPRLVLDPETLRPTDVSPLLAVAGQASGAIEAGAHLYWRSAKGISGDVRLLFDDVSLSSPHVRVDGLDGEVKLREISPPATTGLQTLRAREIHPGVLLSDATLRWALEPMKDGRGSRLRIDRFRAGFADGRITVDDTVFDPHAATNTIVFHLEGLDLAKLFAIANVEGVGGSGRLSGAIPVAARPGSVAIPGGELAAKGGVLQVRSQQVASLLSGGGQSVKLLLDALHDFHYDELTVTVEKAFEGEAAVRLQLAGQNPVVMNGQPFRINLNLTGNLDRLVASLLEIARLSDQTVRATVRGLHPESHR